MSQQTSLLSTSPPIWISPLQSTSEVSFLPPTSSSAMSTVSTTTSASGRSTRSRSVHATPQSEKEIDSATAVPDSILTEETTNRKSAPLHSAQVTPTDLDHTDDLTIFSSKQVRFTGKEEGALSPKEAAIASDGNAKTVNGGGFVSKRGRYVSPGRRTTGSSSSLSLASTSLSSSASPSSPSSHAVTESTSKSNSELSTASVLEYQTYRSPDHSVVPSLCSAPSQDEEKESANDKDASTRSKSPTRDSEVAREAANRVKSPTGLFLLSPSAAADRDRYVGASTPTDFTTDYKQIPAASFDTSNVLAWLQSPTANGFLFSPGFGSMLNTPNYKQSQPSTNPTPIVSTSFFFSDVAGLPKQPQTPAGGTSSGNNNIICISPLASKKQHQTPVDLKEIFASPAERKFRVSSTNGKDAPSLDAVVLAERDLMEDEDLSVLLQLASNTTPRGNVFRSTPRKPLNTTKEEENNNNLPGLQLPMIGGGRNSGNGPKARLSQKSIKCDDFAPPQLGMRSSSSAISSSKELYAGGMQHKSKENGKRPMARSSSLPVSGYPMYPPPDHASYYPVPLPNIPPGMPPGSMHISVGGQPPAKKSKSGKNSPPRSSSYPDFHSAPYHPSHMYQPPPYGVMGYPPYNTGHYPPPPARHLSMYGAAQQSSSSQLLPKDSGSSSGSRSTDKSPTDLPPKKRKSLPDSANQEVKSRKKKSASSNATPGSKKKNKSPQLVDRDERQKAADTIQNLNAASGGKNDKAAALAAAILRGVTMRPSGKWQAQLYFAGKSRYIGVFDTREKAALAYEIAREKLKSGHVPGLDGASTENLVNTARKAAFDGVNERLSSKEKKKGEREE